jgi:hypothetical protein
VAGRVAGLVQVDDTTGNVGLDVTAQGRRAIRDGSEVARSDKEFVIVLKEERPVARVEGRCGGLRLDGEVLLSACFDDGHVVSVVCFYNTACAQKWCRNGDAVV